MSNPVFRMVRSYVAQMACSIAPCLLFLVLFIAPSLAATEDDRPLICVLVPHFKDEYWLSVGYGLEQEAAQQEADLMFFEAGGYRARNQQISQLFDCEETADAILIGAVTSDHPDLIAAIDRVARSVPVFGLVNELHAQSLSGQTGVDWRDMGIVLGRHLSRLHPTGTAKKTALLISGPTESGWAGPLEKGLRDGLEASAIEIVGVFGADTGLQEQLAQAEIALSRFPQADFVIGSAPATEAMIGLQSTKRPPHHAKLVSTYVNHSIKRGLMNGKILAAPFDDPALQGIMALEQAVSFLRTGHSDGQIGPDIVLLKHTDPDLASTRVSPAGYFPSIQ